MAGRVFSLPVQRTIVDGLQEVGGGDAVRLGEVGDRAGDAEDSVVGPGGEAQFLHRLLEQVALRAFEGAVFAELPPAEQRVAAAGPPAEPLSLSGPGGFDPARIVAEGSPGAASRSSSIESAGASTWMSMRSSSGPEILPRYLRTCIGEQVHSRRRSPRWPHGQGFIAATSISREGRVTLAAARETVT